MIQMPRTVRVGPHVFKVERRPVSRMPIVDGEKPNACCDSDRLLVTMRERLQRSKVQEFSVHEFLHAIWPDDDDNEEAHVTKLAPQLLQLIQDNPDFIKFLTQ